MCVLFLCLTSFVRESIVDLLLLGVSMPSQSMEDLITSDLLTELLVLCERVPHSKSCFSSVRNWDVVGMHHKVLWLCFTIGCFTA